MAKITLINQNHPYSTKQKRAIPEIRKQLFTSISNLFLNGHCLTANHTCNGTGYGNNDFQYHIPTRFFHKRNFFND